ncbi:calcium-activated chloride channel regulator 1-like [Daphnia pulicaria]|uniref:calcium-activated chloride channel regulator 1-like n=1 Tax=Daphnia pulicaria TaxID=35523 RepID=UPI001EE9C81E|nr:calcium-activated chloride channel regulator 1-like [Daphnia pulicaria]
MAVCHHRLLLLLLFSCLSLRAIGSRVNITNNGYRDIVIAISPDVPSDQADDLLDNIKLLITEASADLYEATRNRSYIESVNILIPQTWENVIANASTWENLQNADIQIDLPNWKYGERPYTVQLGGCGDPGEYIHLTPNYVKNFDSEFNLFQFGPAGKVIVREWARLRYGVFEEHGYTGDESAFPMFYRSASAGQQTADLVPNVCSDEPVDFTFDYGCHVDPQTGLYDSNCTYSFTDQFRPGSSIMSDYRMLKSAMHFCDDEESSLHKHNREAPNQHNAVCDTQSVWSVITRHIDFVENNNLPATIADLKPTFNVVRVLNGARYVLVTDVSGSMVDYNRIGRLYDSARRWIQYDIPEGTSLGIVKFHSYATVLSNMTVVNDETRQQLMDKVPNKTEDNTCIGCGLQMAIDILHPGGNGGVIVLVTDGLENEYPFIRDVTPELIDAKIQVVSIAFGRDAENEIENLATKTNGKSYFINDNGNNDELNDAFTGSLTYLPAVPSENLTVLLFQKKYQKGNQFEDSVIVDFTVGRNLTFRTEYTNRNYLQNFTVKSPSGQVYNTLIFDNAAKLAYIVIPGIAEEGPWTFFLTVGSSTTDYVNVIVTSKSRSSSTVPITVECSVPSGTVVVDAAIAPVRLVAVVQQGRNRVIGANVQAYVERPDTAIQVIDLVDTGVGADTSKSDGIYSRYYIDLSNAGRYTLVCVVNSTESSYIDDGMGQLQRTTMGDFDRVQSGGTFRVEKPLTPSYSYPPSRVTDLKVVATEVDSTSLTIEWTAPGQELDNGTATEYQIKYSDVFDNLLDNNFNSDLPVQFGQGDVLDGSLQPLESGSKQRVSLALPKKSENVTYFIALRAINNRNVASNTSNVVSVKIVFVQQPETQPPTTRPTVTPIMSSTTKSNSSTSTWSPQTTTIAGSNSGLTSSNDLLILLMTCLSVLSISKVHSVVSSWINRD